MGYRKNLTNPYLYRQFSNSPQEMFNYTMTNLMDSFYDTALSEATDGAFKAVCLSGIKTEDNNGDGKVDELDAEKVLGYLNVIVRPLTPFGGILPDPAGMTDPNEINQIISLHASVFTARSDFEAKNMDAPKFGEILNCYFEQGSIANSDFRGLRFSKVVGDKDFNNDYKKLADVQGVVNIVDKDWNGASLLGNAPESIPPSSEPEIEQLASRFDSEATANKAHNTSRINTAHPEFQKYIKAFIVKCSDKSISIKLNSTHRNNAAQQKLIDEHKAGKRKIKPAQYSYHLSGLAFDFNPTLANGTTIVSTMNKQVWLQSGVPAIGESVGLRWGGYFSTNYDPIHFDFGNKVSSTRNKKMIDEAKQKNVEVTAIPTGV